MNREQILLNSSHTHCSPVVRGCAPLAYDFTPAQQQDVDDYAKVLEDKLVKVIVTASKSLKPARLSYGEDRATFAINRRGRINPDGPVDHTVPVLKISDPAGKLQAILFGYACHNTTLAYLSFVETTPALRRSNWKNDIRASPRCFCWAVAAMPTPIPEAPGNWLSSMDVRWLQQSRGLWGRR